MALSRAGSHRLTILSVAYPLARVGPDAVGGAEQVLTAIDHALVSMGHRSLVIASHGSAAYGELTTYAAPANAQLFDDRVALEQRAQVRNSIQRVLAETGVDLVHMHGIDFDLYLPAPGVPVLATAHLPLRWYSPHALSPSRPSTWLNGVSSSQMRLAEPNPLMLPPVNNGVPVDEFGKTRPRKRGYLLVLARVCPEKGQHLALEAARVADAPLLIGGDVFPYPEHQHYFAYRVRPLLDGRRRYIGPLGFVRKRRLLAGASGLLVPSLVEETSSLVAMEAASCGTPVIAFRAGALPEVIEDGRTGFIVDDVDGMAAAIPRLGEIDPETCRAVARQRFGVDRMAETYINYYLELARPITRFPI